MVIKRGLDIKAVSETTSTPYKLRDQPYEERLRRLKIPTLKYYRKRADALQTRGIVHQVDKLREMDFFERTCGHSVIFQKGHNRTKIRSHTFSQRAINTWNSLPASLVTADKVNTFKSRLEKFNHAQPVLKKRLLNLFTRQRTEHNLSYKYTCGRSGADLDNKAETENLYITW